MFHPTDDPLLASSSPAGVVAVHFDVPADECLRRVQARAHHPTLPPHRGARAIASFEHVLQPPTVAEGFERVHVVKTFAEANALLQQLGARGPSAEALAAVAPTGEVSLEHASDEY